MMGLIAGWLTKKTKGLSMPILLHAINNAIFVYAVAAA
jgi:membrane protease YdiL (CAAX protease family)